MTTLQCPKYNDEYKGYKKGKSTYYSIQIENYLDKYGIETKAKQAWTCFNTTDAPYKNLSSFSAKLSNIKSNIRKGIFTTPTPNKQTTINTPNTTDINNIA